MPSWAVGRLDYLHRLWKLRYFLLALVRCDLDSRYRRSFLGLGWSLLRPLALTAVLCAVFGQLFDVAVREYAPFLLLGLTLWQFLVESALHGCTCFVRAAPYIRQQPVPLALFPLRAVLAVGCNALVGFGLAVAAVVILVGQAGPAALLGLVPCLGLLLLLGWALALLCGLAHTHFPDTQHVLEIAVQILFYLTPVLYRPEGLAGGRLAALVHCNPLTSVLELVRRPLLTGEPPALLHLAVAAGFTAALGLATAACLRRLERTLVFWL